MLETRKAKLAATKGGSGSSTFRVTLPTKWIRKMELSEESRDIKLEFDGKTITVRNDMGE